MLLIEVDGHPAQVADEAQTVERILREGGARGISVARDDAEKNKIWEARRKALPALARRRPTIVLEDATVPRSKIPAMVSCIGEIAKSTGCSSGLSGTRATATCTRQSSATGATPRSSRASKAR